MTPKERIIYDMLVNAAERGDTCPPNTLLATAAGTTPSGATALVNKLLAAGHIAVERTRRSRVVTITATGKSTRPTDLHRGAFARKDDLAEYVANGGALSQAHKLLGCSTQRVWQLWASIKSGMGWQAR